MTADPIEIIPPDPTIRIRSESRIRFSKVYSIEMNVKVKDLGRVHHDHLSNLIAYYKAEGCSPRETQPQSHNQQSNDPVRSSPSSQSETGNANLVPLHGKFDHQDSAVRVDNRLTGELHYGMYHPQKNEV
jgi:hypothetical protein